ncbi:MAG TPA: hypothetical protein VLH19_00965 [Patescibacteria group bacterium]|nr:hypothetical protein [Patescibacteria group bacterium]
MFKKITLVGVSALLLSACSSYTTPSVNPTATLNPTATPAAMLPPVTVKMSAVKNSGQTGTAKFEDLGYGKVKVTLTMAGKKYVDPQPAHIHVGSCPTPGDVKYPLANVVNGTSVTTVSVNMADLWKGGLAVNVHKSAAAISTYTACGNLVAPTTK